MQPVHRQILARHKSTLKGTLRLLPFRSKALGISKPVFVYEPPGFRRKNNISILYLFRGHEREYVNIREDDTRSATSIEMIDELIVNLEIEPVLCIMPGLTSGSNRTHSLGINMAQVTGYDRPELGTGLFWEFLLRELMPFMEARFEKQIMYGKRLISGFSLGGFTGALLTTALPGHFHAAGFYDGLYMYDRQIDRRTGKPDQVWLENSVFDASLGKSRSADSLSPWNPAEIISGFNSMFLDQFCETTFIINCAASDGKTGNRDRNTYFADILGSAGCDLEGGLTVLNKKAEHTWHWNDVFLKRFLKLNTSGNV